LNRGGEVDLNGDGEAAPARASRETESSPTCKKIEDWAVSSKGTEGGKPLFCVSTVTANSLFVAALLIYKW